MYHGKNTWLIGSVSAVRRRRIVNVKSTTLRHTDNYTSHVPYHGTLTTAKDRYHSNNTWLISLSVEYGGAA